MKNKTLLLLSLLVICHYNACAQDSQKVQLEEPKQPDLLSELKGDPDGVLRIKTNDDGSFKSLVVKATSDVEDVLGAEKGKQLARKEAEIQCKRLFSQWMNENCVFAEASNKTVTIQTVGDSAKDASGHSVKIINQTGQEFKMTTESSASFSQAAIKGLMVVSSEVTPDGKEFILIMALTQKSLNQTGAVHDALTGAGSNSSGAAASDASPKSETKVNNDVLNDLK